MKEKDDIVDWVAAYVASDDFQDAIQVFCHDHASAFMDKEATTSTRAEAKEMTTTVDDDMGVNGLEDQQHV